jgi:hypothetical protein
MYAVDEYVPPEPALLTEPQRLQQAAGGVVEVVCRRTIRERVVLLEDVVDDQREGRPAVDLRRESVAEFRPLVSGVGHGDGADASQVVGVDRARAGVVVLPTGLQFRQARDRIAERVPEVGVRTGALDEGQVPPARPSGASPFRRAVSVVPALQAGRDAPE